MRVLFKLTPGALMLAPTAIAFAVFGATAELAARADENAEADDREDANRSATERVGAPRRKPWTN
jgi:hypothetical protein